VGALTHGNVRIALHPGITSDDVDRFVDAATRVIEDLRSEAGAPAIG